jgi:hypothetical protein
VSVREKRLGQTRGMDRDRASEIASVKFWIIESILLTCYTVKREVQTQSRVQNLTNTAPVGVFKLKDKMTENFAADIGDNFKNNREGIGIGQYGWKYFPHRGSRWLKLCPR